MQILNAYQNNLKNISLRLPENQLIVLTGLSGSGKSSLAIDVIANEGYRYFLESLPDYNQQNSQIIPTAEVNTINNLPPVIKVEQSKSFQSVKATFGTLSELNTYFRILFARFSAEETLSKSLFSFNHPKGACKTCRGLGKAEYIDLNKLIADENKSLREGAITTTLPNGYIVYSQITVEELNKVCQAHGFTIDIPWKNLSAEQKDVVLNGSKRVKVFFGKHGLESRLRWKGIKAKPREEGFYKGMLPVMEDILRRDRNPNILKFASAKTCPNCKGARIKAEHLKYQWKGLNFQGWMQLSLKELYTKLTTLQFNAGEEILVEKIKTKIADFLLLGMGDYQLNTPSNNISSGDAQRIKLINQVNSQLQGILYVFDEPSIGLPAAYQKHLRQILNRLIKAGNTVLVVEHDLDFIQAADWIVELGPKAGINGGELIFNDSVANFLAANNIESPTLAALQDAKKLSKAPNNSVKLTEENFKPRVKELAVVSRKTQKTLAKIKDFCDKEAFHSLLVNDKPIGKTPRSNPATYTGLANKIRNLLAKTSEAKSLKLTKSAFSFNNKTGRCPACEGAGVISLSMNVLGNINQVCPTCNGKRFKPEVLRVAWQGKNIAEIYELSIKEALTFFSPEGKIKEILQLMIDLGLGYIKLGQPSNTLSGGEAQRIKLTKHFAKKSEKTLLLLEEPSIGLHYQNVKQLLAALHHLKEQTAGIVCFENHPLFEKSADVLVSNKTLTPSINDWKDKRQQRKDIVVKNARTHHLKDLSLHFPKQRLTVVSGISGSGKSSLVIDTLHGFGLQEMTKQFSSYQQSRAGVNFQFGVDFIEGLTPTICVSRKQKNFSARTDIAKQTGIDKILRFVFSRKAQYEGEDLSASHFSNSHELGKCPICEGLGDELLPDLNKIILDANQSIANGLLAHNKVLAYYGDVAGKHMAVLKEVGKAYGFDLETPFGELDAEQKKILLYGTGKKIWEANWNYKTKTRKGTQALSMPWEGIFTYLQDEYFKTRKNKNIQKLTALFSYSACKNCKGSGLKPERLKYEIAGKSIAGIKTMNFKKLDQFLAQNVNAKDIDGKLLHKLQTPLSNTIKRAKQLHVDYLQLNRKSVSLSGGENQRIELIKQLNSPLKGITYLLDEPSAGLSYDNIQDLLEIMQELIKKGNTLIVIEHNKEIILAADKLVQLGPKAGNLGGYITFEGKPKQFLQETDCHPYLKTGRQKLQFKKGKENIFLQKIAKHSLVKEQLEIPVGGITAISGKSGVGKTTLVKEVLLPSINYRKPINCASINFPERYTAAHYFESKKLKTHAKTLLVDYLNLLKEIAKIFAAETNLKAKDFSYKTKNSQCPNCKGKGFTEISLDVAANLVEPCEVCKGKRYKPQILAHQVGAKNIAEVLGLSLAELKEFLQDKLSKKSLLFLDQLEEIGLAQLSLDQPVQTLSSGEKQRLLLLDWLQKADGDALYILDEPSTGLHYADIDLLLTILQKLSEKNDVLVIDHNLYLLQKIGVGMVLE